jgi:hypothetical protein
MQYSEFETAERDKEEYYVEKLKIKEGIKISQYNGGRTMVIKQENRRDG